MKWAAPIAVGVLALVLWQALVKALDVPHYLVPSPLLVAQTLVNDWGLLFSSLLITLKITFGAFFMAVLIGTTVAFLFVQSRWIELSFFPYAVLLQVTADSGAQVRVQPQTTKSEVRLVTTIVLPLMMLATCSCCCSPVAAAEV